MLPSSGLLNTPYKKLLLPLLLLAGGLPLTSTHSAEREIWTFSGSLELGAEYSSNVNISELEAATGSGDNAGVLDAGLNLTWQPTERWRGESGYSYSTKRYQEADAFNLDIHLAYGDISYEADFATLGMNYYHAHALLAGEGFMTLGQFSAYAGKLFGDHWYLRGALNLTDKDFVTLEERDADNQGLSLDNFWFFNEGRSNLMLGFNLEDESAQNAAFDYAAYSLRARYSHRWTAFGQGARLHLGLRHQTRNYRSAPAPTDPVTNRPVNRPVELPTPELIEEARQDRRLVADARLELGLSESLALIGRVELGNYQSNLASADYRDNRASVALRWSF